MKMSKRKPEPGSVEYTKQRDREAAAERDAQIAGHEPRGHLPTATRGPSFIYDAPVKPGTQPQPANPHKFRQ
jgi:hypothetical protein